MKPVAVILISLFIMANRATSQTPVYQTDGVAIHGYDPVAYFSEGKALPGNAEYSFEWNGARWQFASIDNVEKFKQNPEQYAPQYGGYCAYGASRGYLAPTIPQAFTIVDNKLYLNYSLDVRAEWIKDAADRISKADVNWNAKLKFKVK